MRKKLSELITYSIFHTKNTKDLCVNEENPELTRSQPSNKTRLNTPFDDVAAEASYSSIANQKPSGYIYLHFLQNTILRLIITIANHKNPPATLTEFSLENSFF